MDLNDINKTVLSGIADRRMHEANPQIGAFEVLKELIEEFQSKLDADHELGAHIANTDVPFHVRDVSRRGALFLFEGVDNAGQDVMGVQHFTQLNIQLVKMKKLKPLASRVGFLSP